MQRFAAGAGLCAAMLTTVPLAAQGFAINEWNACSMGRGGTAVARACPGGLTGWFNPAAIGGQPGTQLTAGLLLVRPSGSFTHEQTGERTSLESFVAPLPYAHLTRSLARSLGVGLSVTAPYRLETRWPTTFEGRFAGYHSSLLAVYVQPAVGYDLLDLLRVGLGIDVVFADVELRQRADLARATVLPGLTFANLGIPLNTEFADVTLAADGTGVGFNLGAQLTLWPTVVVGVSYLHHVTVDFQGDARFRRLATGLVLPDDNPITGVVTAVDDLVASQFTGTGPLTDGPAGTTITLPQQLRAGLAWDATPALAIFAEYHRQGWSRFDQIDIDFANPSTPDRTLVQAFRDSHGVRLGAEYAVAADTRLRAGYIWHSAATPDATVTPLLPEATRNAVSGGASFALTESVRGHVALEVVRQADRRGRVLDAPPGVDGATLNVGLYEVTALLLATSVTYTF